MSDTTLYPSPTFNNVSILGTVDPAFPVGVGIEIESGTLINTGLIGLESGTVVTGGTIHIGSGIELSGTTLENSGLISFQSGTTQIAGTITAGSNITFNGQTLNAPPSGVIELVQGTVSASGTIAIGANITLASGTLTGEPGGVIELYQGSVSASGSISIGSYLTLEDDVLSAAEQASSLEFMQGTLSIIPTALSIASDSLLSLTSGAEIPPIIQSFTVSLGNPPNVASFDNDPVEGNLLVVFVGGIGASAAPDGYTPRAGYSYSVANSYVGTKSSIGADDKTFTISSSTGSGRQFQVTAFEIGTYGDIFAQAGVAATSSTNLAAAALSSAENSLILTNFQTTSGQPLGSPIPSGSEIIEGGYDADGWAWCVVQTEGDDESLTVGVSGPADYNAAYSQIQISPNSASIEGTLSSQIPVTINGTLQTGGAVALNITHGTLSTVDLSGGTLSINIP